MPGRRIAAGSGRCDPGIKNLPAFRLFIDLLAGEGGHRAIKALLAKSVTHVFGINRNPCVRNGPLSSGALGEIRTPDPRIRSRLCPLLYQRLSRFVLQRCCGYFPSSFN
jgi:hypothetical protein